MIARPTPDQHDARGRDEARYAASPEGILLEANPQLLALLGYSHPADVVGLRACDLVVEDSCSDVEERQVDYISTTSDDRPRTYRAQLRRGDGTLIWVRDTCRAVRDNEGRLVRFEGCLTNGSGALPATQDATPTGDARYRALFESIPVGLYVTTAQGVILEANSELARMLEVDDKRSLIGLNAADLYVDPEDRCAALAALASSGATSSHEVQLRTRRGRAIWVVDTCRGLRDVDGKLFRVEGSLRDVTEARELDHRLRLMARHDPLTGVYNRYALGEILASEAARSRRYRHPIGLLMVDIDRFKEINDQFGHATGDEILRRVATVLRRTVRDSDIVVRYGGDEFLILLVETDGESLTVKKRIQAAVERHLGSDSPIGTPVRVAIGAAHWSPDSEEAIESVIHRADCAMYADKHGAPPPEGCP
ncbi:MAG: sensor domain-containing diguanylate cyclase [Candidatus Bipolaricaulota bacterium]